MWIPKSTDTLDGTSYSHLTIENVNEHKENDHIDSINVTDEVCNSDSETQVQKSQDQTKIGQEDKNSTILPTEELPKLQKSLPSKPRTSRSRKTIPRPPKSKSKQLEIPNQD